MRDTKLLQFILGMAASLIMLCVLVLLGPRVIPAQFDQCQVELRKAQPKCSIRERGGFTFVRDSRCVQAAKGMMMLAQDDSGWWRLGRLPEPAVDKGVEPNQ